jgi:hypothetical protein
LKFIQQVGLVVVPTRGEFDDGVPAFVDPVADQPFQVAQPFVFEITSRSSEREEMIRHSPSFRRCTARSGCGRSASRRPGRSDGVLFNRDVWGDELQRIDGEADRTFRRRFEFIGEAYPMVSRPSMSSLSSSSIRALAKEE